MTAPAFPPRLAAFRAGLVAAALLGVAGCAQLPFGTGSDRAADAPYPDLVPIRMLRPEAGDDRSDEAGNAPSDSALAARAALLRRRAAELRAREFDA